MTLSSYNQKVDIRKFDQEIRSLENFSAYLKEEFNKVVEEIKKYELSDESEKICLELIKKINAIIFPFTIVTYRVNINDASSIISLSFHMDRFFCFFPNHLKRIEEIKKEPVVDYLIRCNDACTLCLTLKIKYTGYKTKEIM